MYRYVPVKLCLEKKITVRKNRIKRIKWKVKLSENCTETPAEFGQILAGAGEWPGAPISAGAGAGAPVDHWFNI